MQKKSPGKRRTMMNWLQFRLWHLLILITIVAIGVGIYSEVESRIVEAENAVKIIEAYGNSVEYESVGPSWLPERYRRRVVKVRLEYGPFSDDPFADFMNGDDPFAPPTDVVAGEEVSQEEFLAQLAKLRFVRSLDMHGLDFGSDFNAARHFHRDWPLEELILPARLLDGDDNSVLRNYQTLRKLTISDHRVDGVDFSFLEDLNQLEELVVPAPLLAGVDKNLFRNCQKLCELTIHGQGVDGVDFSFLENLNQLQVLDLSWSTLGDDDLRHFVHLRELQSLDLSTTLISDDGLRHLSEMHNLTNLNLRRTKVSGHGLAHLSGLHELRTLDLTPSFSVNMSVISALGPDGFPNRFPTLEERKNSRQSRDLSKMPVFPALEELRVRDAVLNEASFAAIGRQPRLRILNLRFSHLENDWLQHLAGSKLEEIYLDRTDINQTGMATICQIPTLEVLFAEEVNVTAAEFAEVLPQARQLIYLRLRLDEYPPEFIAALKQLPRLADFADDTNGILFEDLIASEDEAP